MVPLRTQLSGEELERDAKRLRAGMELTKVQAGVLFDRTTFKGETASISMMRP